MPGKFAAAQVAGDGVETGNGLSLLTGPLAQRCEHSDATGCG